MVVLGPSHSLYLLSVLVISVSSEALPKAVETWKDWTCPPPETSILSLTQTQYVPVTTTETDTSTTAITEIKTETITQYSTIVVNQTVTATETTPTTEILTTPTTLYETATITETKTKTETQTTTSPLTLTATEEIDIFSSTTQLTSLRICPTRVVNPTFTVQGPLPTDWTWGCPPGWLCKPQQADCDFEAGLPDRGFYCAPNECIPAEALPQPLLTWNMDPTGNFTPADDPSLRVNAIDSYFNMNPTEFGLDYDIFVVNQVITYTSTSVVPPAAPTLTPRQAQTVVPGACYDWCNNVLLEAQSQGKSPALCRPESAFRASLSQCLICVAVHADDDVGNFVQIAPQFQQFLDYCDQQVAVVQTVVTTTSTIAGSTVAVVLPTTSVTIIPVNSTTAIATPAETTIPVTTIEAATPATTVETTIPVSTAEVTTVATLPTTLTLVAGATTLTGTDLNQFTIVMASGNSTTTLAGSELQNATLVLPGTTTGTSTGSYTTTIVTSEVVFSTGVAITSGPTSVVLSESSSTPSAPSSSFTGAAGIIAPHYRSSWLATFLAGLLTLF